MARRHLCSVLLCTYNRSALLERTLESLCEQTHCNENFEVIVMDDGSVDDTRSVSESFKVRLPLRYVYQRNSGLASARNHALFHASGDILLLLDDDDIAHPELIEEHVRVHNLYPEDNYAVLGFTDLAPEIAADPLMHFVTRVGKFLFSYPDLEPGQVVDFSYFWGGRSSCKRRFLLDWGIFDPAFRFGCEDIELSFRLSRQGFKVVYNPCAITTMVRPYSFDGFCNRLIKQGQSNYVFSRFHNEAIVRAWTEIEDIRKWAVIEPAYEFICKSGRDLDQLYRLKLSLGMVTAEDTGLLHEAYWNAFRASKIKGMAERAMAEGDERPHVTGSDVKTTLMASAVADS